MLLKRAKPREAKIDIIPMIDIVFQLIIFFLVSTQVKQQETDVDLELPTAKESEEVKSKDPPLLINVVRPRVAESQGGRPYVMQAVFMNLEELTRKLKEQHGVQKELNRPMPAVRIRGDRNSNFEDVRRALAACVDIGIQEVRVATIKMGGS